MRGFFFKLEPTLISMQICLTLTRLKSNLNPIIAVSVLNKLNSINFQMFKQIYLETKRNYWFLQDLSLFVKIKTSHNLFPFSEKTRWLCKKLWKAIYNICLINIKFRGLIWTQRFLYIYLLINYGPG